jgi:1-acyl-sn-glycerol-3-phosphate acyltransferase
VTAASVSPGALPAQVPRAGALYRFAAEAAFAVFSLQGWRHDVTGLEHVPTSGGAVIAANHTSFWDFFTVGRPIFREYGRPIRIMAKESLFHAPVFGWLMKQAEHIPVHRGGGTEALSSGIEALQAGELVLVLPEQTISTSFELLPFKAGAARMAAAAGVPLIPAASWGSHRFHTVGRLPRPHWRLPVSVGFGAPLLPEPGADPLVVTEELRTSVRGVLDGLQARYPERPKPGKDWWVPSSLGGSAPDHRESMRQYHEHQDRWRDRRAG